MLAGGPGCTSLLGAFYENGPLTMKGFRNDSTKYHLEVNPYSWNNVAHVLYVEQPIRCASTTLDGALYAVIISQRRTGFSQPSSTAKKIRSERQVAIDFRAFLSSFIQVSGAVPFRQLHSTMLVNILMSLDCLFVLVRLLIYIPPLFWILRYSQSSKTCRCISRANPMPVSIFHGTGGQCVLLSVKRMIRLIMHQIRQP